LAVHQDLSTAGLFQARSHTQTGCFAASGWTNNGHEFLILNLKIDVLQGDDILFALTKNSCDVSEFNRCHLVSFCERCTELKSASGFDDLL